MKNHTFAFTDISIHDINTVPVTPSAFQNKCKYFPGYYRAQIGPFLFSFSLEACKILYCHNDGEACLIVIMENKKCRYRGGKKERKKERDTLCSHECGCNFFYNLLKWLTMFISSGQLLYIDPQL